MNLFRSEEHARHWSLYSSSGDDYIMPVSDWADVFTASLFKNRLEEDYLSHTDSYLADYRLALKSKGRATPAPDRRLATVLITDIVNSTEHLNSMGDVAWHRLLDEHNKVIRAEIERWRGEEVSTAGDSFFVTFDGSARAVQAAQAMVGEVAKLGIEIRAGLHTGEVEIVDGKAAGTAVHIGARISALAQGSEILVSRTVKETIAGSGITFEDRGSHTLKGVPGRVELYATVSD